jgi:hypothetical protein
MNRSHCTEYGLKAIARAEAIARLEVALGDRDTVAICANSLLVEALDAGRITCTEDAVFQL